MTKSPSVVIMNQFTPSYNNLNLDYKSKKQVYNSAMNMFDYYSDNKKKAFFMLDYFSGKIGKDKEMNIIFEDGKYATKEDGFGLLKLLKESNANIKEIDFESENLTYNPTELVELDPKIYKTDMILELDHLIVLTEFIPSI